MHLHVKFKVALKLIGKILLAIDHRIIEGNHNIVRRLFFGYLVVILIGVIYSMYDIKHIWTSRLEIMWTKHVGINNYGLSP